MGLAHVRAKHNLCALFHQIFDGGKCADDTVFVGNHAVFHRYVEITSDENFFAFYFYVFYRFLVHSLENLLDINFFVPIYNTLFFTICQLFGKIIKKKICIYRKFWEKFAYSLTKIAKCAIIIPEKMKRWCDL